MTAPTSNGTNAPVNASGRTKPLTATERRRLTTNPVGVPWDVNQRLFAAFDNGTVFDYGDTDPADIADMLGRDGKARSLEQVLTLPLRSATWTIDEPEGDTGQTKLVRDTLAKKLSALIDQMTTAVAYRRAFFETTWALLGGRIVYDRIEWRPATSCEAGFDPATGAPRGFRQRVVPMAGVGFTVAANELPGYRTVKPERAFVYTHGAYRDPIHGVSDLDVSLWAYETRQKILFLWFQFLEQQSLPKTAVFADDIDTARELAEDVAGMKASAVIGMARHGDPQAKVFETIESSGAGASQFLAAVAYLEQQMTTSVLAGFTDLPNGNATGSYALSADQSEFFLASRQAVADEMATAIVDGVFAPLVAHNFGPDAPVPTLTIGPLSRRSTDRALTLLTAVVSAQQLNIPREFVDQLTASVATHLGLDEAKVADAIEAEVARREEQDKIKAEQQKQLLANPVMAAQAGASPLAKPKSAATTPPRPPKPVVPKSAAVLTAAVDTAYRLITEADPVVELAQREHTGGMICLLPDPATAAKLALPDGEAAEQLHVTLAYLGDDVTDWDEKRHDALVAAVHRATARTAELTGPLITARAFAHTTFNADGGPDGQRKPCAVYGIGESPVLDPLQHQVLAELDAVDGFDLPTQHDPWVPHLTAAYDRTAADLTYLGPVTFDRLAVALAGVWTDLPLNGEES